MGSGWLEVPGGPGMVPDVQKMRLCTGKGRARVGSVTCSHTLPRAHTPRTHQVGIGESWVGCPRHLRQNPSWRARLIG